MYVGCSHVNACAITYCSYVGKEIRDRPGNGGSTCVIQFKF